MSSFGVILDACVLIPAALRDTLLRTAAAALYRLHWSEDILTEVERNLVEHKMTSTAGARRVIGAMREAFPEADVDGYQRLIPTMANHEKDRHILAAAVVAGAQVIVTMNLKDFPDHALIPFGIEAQSPDEFLLIRPCQSMNSSTVLQFRLHTSLNSFTPIGAISDS